MLTRREVKYTLAAPRCTCLPPRQHCAGVALGSPPPTPLKFTKAKSRYNETVHQGAAEMYLLSSECNFSALLMRRRQVQRGAAELYLSSYQINNAEESAVDYRVQLQRNVDEEGGKYTEAQPRCTWPLSESTLRQGRWGPPPLLSDFRLVHWRNPSLFFYRTLFIPADCHPHLYRAQKRETYLTANTMSSGFNIFVNKFVCSHITQ